METFPEKLGNVNVVFSTDFTMCAPKHKISQRFLAKNFVDSIIIVTFAAEFERTEKNGRDEDSNKRAY